MLGYLILKCNSSSWKGVEGQLSKKIKAGRNWGGVVKKKCPKIQAIWCFLIAAIARAVYFFHGVECSLTRKKIPTAFLSHNPFTISVIVAIPDVITI